MAAHLGTLVHPCVGGDPIAAARHQSFIVSHLAGGLVALAALAIHVAVTGALTPATAGAFLWLLSPIAIAVFLSRTGRLAAAHLISAANLAALVTFAAALTGGLTSFLIPWMLIVPLEAALSGDRRVVLAASAVAGLALVALAAAGVFGILPASVAAGHDAQALAFLGTASAMLYGGGLALSVQRLHARAQAALVEGEARYRLLADNATDLISRHTAAGDVTFASPAARAILGAPPEALRGRGLFERVHVADRPAYLTALSRCAARAEPASAEFRVRHGGTRGGGAGAGAGAGAYVWLEMRCRPVAGGEGGIVAVSRDVTAHKRQEELLLRARDHAEGASRAKTQFLAHMSHELRTPLNAIIGFSEILARELFGRLGEDRYRDYARLIHESGEHLLSVVNEILDMSKIEAGKFRIVPEPFDLAALIASCSEIMRHGAERKSVRLEVAVPEGLPEIVADRKACKQMLLNLLSNAVKFTPEGGRVRVSAARAGAMIEIAVADTGIGIAKEDLARLGNPFVQADTSYNRSFEGTGLGLSVVKGLARLHGGTLEIDSTPGEGTTVTVRLPMVAETGAEETENAAPRHAAAAGA